MAKTKISEFSTTAGNNTDINSINIAEGCAPSGINDAIRELMRQLKEFQTGGAGDSVNSGGDFSVATNKFTVASASGNTAVAGTLAVTGVATLTAQPILSSLTASKAVFTDASKGLVSNDVTGTGNVVMSNSPTLVTPALGTPASGVVTNLTGTASININGTVGATTPSTGAFTTLSSTGNTTLGDASGDTITVNGTTTFVNANPTLSAGTANGVLYLNGSKVATSGSALTFDGTNLLTLSASAPKIRVSDSGLANDFGIDFYFPSVSASYGQVTLNGSTGGMRFVAGKSGSSGYYQAFELNGSEQMRVTSTGVGIGTSSPGAKLHVDGTGSGLLLTGSGYTNNPSGLMLGLYNSTTAYIQQPASASLQFWKGDSSALMTLDTSGNLGLGVTPSAWTVFKAMQLGSTMAIGGVNGSSSNVFANTYYDGAYKYIGTGSAYRYEQNIATGYHAWFTAPSGTAGNAITFTQAMTLNSSGALLIGTTATGLLNLNYFYFDPASGYGGNAVVGHVSGTSSGVPYFTFAYNASNIGSITQSGTTAVLYNTTSDQRLKENIADADSASTLIDSLQVRKFDWKSDGSHQRYGFVAQELVTVAPEAVHQPADPEEMMAVDYSKLVPMLVKEIQSLRKRLADAGIA